VCVCVCARARACVCVCVCVPLKREPEITPTRHTNTRWQALDALRDNCALNKEMRIKLADASKFFSRSVTIRDECFRLWVQVYRLDKQVGASALKSLANGARTLMGTIFAAWLRLVQNKKRAFARWANGTLLWAFQLWSAVVAAEHDFNGMLEGKLGGRLLAAGKVLRGLIFGEWCDLVRKRKKALKRWTHSALVHMFQLWAGECAERWELYAQVQEKCKGVAARLKGAWRDICFHAWSSSVLKDRRARARFANSTLYMCLSSWKGLAREETRRRELLARIRMRIERRCEILVLQAYRDVVAERVHVKRVLQGILKMWIDKGRRAGFRSLWHYAHRRKVHRRLVAEGLARLLLFRCRMGFLCFSINRAQEVRVRVVLARIRWRPAAVALEVWSRHVMDVIYAHQRALADKSPIIARFLKRAMVEAFLEWGKLAAEATRHRRIIASIRTRVIYASAIAALQQWAVYMEDMAEERHQELVACAQQAVKAADLAPLYAALARHFELPHVRRRYSALSMRQVLVQVLSAEGASHDTLSLLGVAPLEHETPAGAGSVRAAAARVAPPLRTEVQSIARFR